MHTHYSVACLTWQNSLHSFDTSLLVNAADSTPALHRWRFHTDGPTIFKHPPLATSPRTVGSFASRPNFSTGQKRSNALYHCIFN